MDFTPETEEEREQTITTQVHNHATTQPHNHTTIQHVTGDRKHKRIGVAEIFSRNGVNRFPSTQ